MQLPNTNTPIITTIIEKIILNTLFNGFMSIFYQIIMLGSDNYYNYYIFQF
jgi:hypothetical protein